MPRCDLGRRLEDDFIEHEASCIECGSYPNRKIEISVELIVHVDEELELALQGGISGEEDNTEAWKRLTKMVKERELKIHRATVIDIMGSH